jgi:hypothetical protein
MKKSNKLNNSEVILHRLLFPQDTKKEKNMNKEKQKYFLDGNITCLFIQFLFSLMDFYGLIHNRNNRKKTLFSNEHEFFKLVNVLFSLAIFFIKKCISFFFTDYLIALRANCSYAGN